MIVLKALAGCLCSADIFDATQKKAKARQGQKPSRSERILYDNPPLCICFPAVHHASPAQPATLRLWVRPNGPSGCRDHAQHGEAHPAVVAVHRLLQEHIHPSREPGLLHAGLHTGRAAAEDTVPGNGTQRHLQVKITKMRMRTEADYLVWAGGAVWKRWHRFAFDETWKHYTSWQCSHPYKKKRNTDWINASAIIKGWFRNLKVPLKL